MHNTNEIISVLKSKTQELEQMYSSLAEARESGAASPVSHEEVDSEGKRLIPLILKTYETAKVSYIMADILLKPASAKPLSAAKMQKITHSISVGNQLVHAAAVATSIVMAGQMQEAPSIALMAIIFGQINDVIEPAENNAMQAKPDLEVAEELPQKKQCLGL